MEPRDGYIEIHVAEVSYEGNTFEDVSFNLELSVENGVLAAQVSNVSAMGSQVDDNLFGPVNQMITEKLVDAQSQMEIMDRAELVDVTVSPDGVTLVWRLRSADGN